MCKSIDAYMNASCSCVKELINQWIDNCDAPMTVLALLGAGGRRSNDKTALNCSMRTTTKQKHPDISLFFGLCFLDYELQIFSWNTYAYIMAGITSRHWLNQCHCTFRLHLSSLIRAYIPLLQGQVSLTVNECARWLRLVYNGLFGSMLLTDDSWLTFVDNDFIGSLISINIDIIMDDDGSSMNHSPSILLRFIMDNDSWCVNLARP